jgi:chromosome segregation ATPase
MHFRYRNRTVFSTIYNHFLKGFFAGIGIAPFCSASSSQSIVIRGGFGFMQQQQSGVEPIAPDPTPATNDADKVPGEIEALSCADATSLAEIEEQANQLLEYINKLSSLADRACDTAIRQTESAQHFEETHQNELADLRQQLEQNTAIIEDRNREILTLEQTSKEQITNLENHLREKDAQIDERETELKHLRAEITCLLNRLNDNEQAVKQSEQQIQQQVEPLNQELAALKTQLAQRDELLQTRNDAHRKAEFELRQNSLELEKRLKEMEGQLQSQEAQLKEKDALIQATAAKEVEIGKLIKRLSTECANLSTELQEKTRLLGQVDVSKAQPQTEKKVWRRVMGRLQEEPL